MAKKAGSTDGNAVLYHYLQHSLQQDDVWLFQMLVAKLVVALGIWFPVDTYRRLPIALPFVVRDPACRRPIDEWSSPNQLGLLRDDNSMIKSLVKGMGIDRRSATSTYRNKILGNGFVAAHVWRQTTAGGLLASRCPETNSFLPNLVWLPSNVAKLTDREGSFAQRYVQAIADKIYRHAEMGPQLQPFAERAWELLPEAEGFPDQALPDPDDLNWFDVPESFIPRAVGRIRTVARALEAVGECRNPIGKVVSSRYTAGVSQIEREVAADLGGRLRSYCEAVESDPEPSDR